MLTLEFHAALAKLEELAAMQSTTIMCAEAHLGAAIDD
jgi:hypothetical protein